MEGEDNAKLDSPSGLPFDNDSVSDNAGRNKEELENDRGRKFRQGDFVAHISNLDKTLGQVVQINQLFRLYGSKTLNSYIPSNQLKRVTKFLEGDLVVLDNWLGKVDFVTRDVTVKFKNESLCTFKGGMGLHPHVERDGLPLQLGQEVNVSPKRTCTVTKLVDGSVFVEWIVNSDGNDDSPPFAKQDPNRLTLVFSFRSTWKYGNVCQHVLLKPETIFLLGDVKTSVDVTWQNGSTEKNLPPPILKPISDIGVHDFLIGQYVVLDNSEGLGVVKSVDHKEKTTTVRWVNLPNEEIINSCHLNRHHLFNYHLGNLVFRQITRETENSDLSSFGIIIGFKDGDIEVTWADGTTSMVQPQELHGVIDRDKYEDTDECANTGIEHEVEGDALVVKIPEFKVDLLNFVDLRSVQCLNGSRIHCISNALEKDYRVFNGLNLESVADEQLLIYVPFMQPINLHSLVIGGPVEEGPKTVKLFANKRHFDLSDAAKTTPRETVILSEDNLRGTIVKLNQVKFQSIHSVTIFIEDNQYGSELTRVQRIYLFGTSSL
ncbi:probable ubiquitin-conjugating enzyme E2 24 [Solanum stenotomum]|uniref:probable ubiquitin-conjugating enzyme E2 24 n=1 Tax=Solanum stenotomum TaxID=172797 RepID=UPI0020D0920C|nr:probable ubiquitin-conjugating enzyme E2 24 [Solanum stenotomum]